MIWGIRMIRLVVRVVVTTAMAATAIGCGGSSPDAGSRYVRYHDPSGGWTANVPAGWTSVIGGPEFVRGEPLADPTRLLLRTYRDQSPAAALRALAAGQGITARARTGARTGQGLRWQRYEGRKAELAVELAVAKEGADAHVGALIARRAELGRLVRTALLPALDSFVSGSPDKPDSVLGRTPGDPSYWPTSGWRSASPASEGMDGRRLDEMIATIRSAQLPIDSVTVIRHGNVVLDARFGPFAEGRLPEPFAAGRLHELQSATKSVSSMVLGIALRDRAASGVDARTPVVRLAAAVHYRPKHLGGRKRAMTLEDMLTMQSGLAWRESGYAYEPGSGNDVMAMLQAGDWSAYVLDRPMATRPGTSFVYNTGSSHLVSGAVTVLTRRPAAEFAQERLFAPLGIRDVAWPSDPSGVTAGGFGLRLGPRDLAKLAYLYLHQGRWDGRQIVPAAWVTQSTADHVADPLYDYGYLWWLDRADGYAYMAGLYGQLAAVIPGKDLVAVVTAHLPANVDATSVTRWLLEKYILPAAG
jgi:CubicO group peptidase (beta-lactamase class C family)